jgi:hypothetical protein
VGFFYETNMCIIESVENIKFEEENKRGALNKIFF